MLLVVIGEEGMEGGVISDRSVIELTCKREPQSLSVGCTNTGDIVTIFGDASLRQ